MRSKHVGIVVAAIAFVSVGSISFATLIGILPEFPALVFNGQGSLTYDSAADLVAVDASPVAIRFSPTSFPRFVNPTGDPLSEVLAIRMIVDENGTFIEGVPNEDLILTGEVDANGDGTIDFAGILLTGEAAEFGFEDTGTVTDLYDFRFTVTGGRWRSSLRTWTSASS